MRLAFSNSMHFTLPQSACMLFKMNFTASWGFFIFFWMLNLVVSKVATGLYRVIICHQSFCDWVRDVFTAVCSSRDTICESLRTSVSSSKIDGIIFCKSKRHSISATKAVRPVISEPTRHCIIRAGNVTVAVDGCQSPPISHRAPRAMCTSCARTVLVAVWSLAVAPSRSGSKLWLCGSVKWEMVIHDVACPWIVLLYLSFVTFKMQTPYSIWQLLFAPFRRYRVPHLGGWMSGRS